MGEYAHPTISGDTFFVHYSVNFDFNKVPVFPVDIARGKRVFQDFTRLLFQTRVKSPQLLPDASES
ncbi:MAG TPA: hypothetical protein VFE47_03780 [Tepidisphaeraceae bacterium]|nr:hypothetical protein [Tepidisphaeraceae bacterium]